MSVRSSIDRSCHGEFYDLILYEPQVFRALINDGRSVGGGQGAAVPSLCVPASDTTAAVTKNDINMM